MVAIQLAFSFFPLIFAFVLVRTQKSNCQYSHFLFPFLPQWLHSSDHNGSVRVTKASEISEINRSYLYAYSDIHTYTHTHTHNEWSVDCSGQSSSQKLMLISLSFSCVLVCTSRNIHNQQQQPTTTMWPALPQSQMCPLICELSSYFYPLSLSLSLSLFLPLSLSLSFSQSGIHDWNQVQLFSS